MPAAGRKSEKIEDQRGSQGPQASRLLNAIDDEVGVVVSASGSYSLIK